jgi:hypothetical protein
MDIRSGQKRAWANKVAKKGSVRPLSRPEFCLLQGKIAEAFDACRNPYFCVLCLGGSRGGVIRWLCCDAVQCLTGRGESPARSACSAAAVMFRSMPPNTTPWNGEMDRQ